MYAVNNEDEELGIFKTKKQAQAFIKRLKKFDKEQRNPFNEQYTITKVDPPQYGVIRSNYDN